LCWRSGERRDYFPFWDTGERAALVRGLGVPGVKGLAAPCLRGAPGSGHRPLGCGEGGAQESTPHISGVFNGTCMAGGEFIQCVEALWCPFQWGALVYMPTCACRAEAGAYPTC